ncbi:MAG TPA: hypothetical protein VFT45_15670 [Longimicrobium sp.]|nr:hypothetical protein [Longimicrobium sp.]
MADSDEVIRALYHALSNEIVRSTIRTQLQSIPRPLLIKLLGVSAKRFRHFMEGGEPSAKLWDAVEAFEEGMQEPVELDLEAVALNLIVERLPNWNRPRVRKALADAIRPILQAEGREVATL